MNLSTDEVVALQNWGEYFGYIPTWVYAQFMARHEKIICFFTGNRFGKNDTIATSYVQRILGTHPVEEKNLRPNKPVRMIRFASETLPNDPEGGEVKNTQYPIFKKRLPPSLIKKDITIRKPVMTIRDPQGGKDIFVEFTSYGQSVQSQAGVERFSCWCDESSPKNFYEEQLPRLMETNLDENGNRINGDLIYSLTPAEFLTWEYDTLFESAKVYIRSKPILMRLFERENRIYPSIETTDSEKDIAVIMAATDDNPTYSLKNIDELLSGCDSDDMVDIRRYGIFKQVSGQIFKDFDLRYHVIKADKYFENGLVPNDKSWVKGRFIDYHELVPWAISWLTLSPTDECFVFNEMNPSPERMVTHQIARQMAYKSLDYSYILNLTDPWAAKTQPNTGMSIQEDLNRIFHELKKEGICTGGYWQSWDTKSTRGRDEIRKRLKNSLIVGRPFNNIQLINNRKVSLPTIWFFDNCKQTILSMKNWRKEEWLNREMLVTKDEKDKPQQKWSHFPMCLEAAFKHPAFRPKRDIYVPHKPPKQASYFKGSHAYL